MDVIRGAVGQGGGNQVPTVRVVQRLLNDWLVRNGQRASIVDGLADRKTIEAITEFQRTNSLRAEGRWTRADQPSARSSHIICPGSCVVISGYGLARYVDTSVIKDEALSDPNVKETIQTYSESRHEVGEQAK
jgi:peptidoglycan hydrolase-like protein with peptidoglycan-binding domain